MTELIISEKPDAALRIATALAENKVEKHLIGKVPYYELMHKRKRILVGCAVGHLYTLTEKEKKGLAYPVFDLEWKPTSEIKKISMFTKKYLDVLRRLSREAKEFTIACDYDIEGSVIGFNCIRFICGKKDAKRMKFSTLTKDELIESYENAYPHLDFPLINAGEARHFMDYMWGISLSRGLMSSIKKAGSFKIMSTGRVQGPTLKIIVDRELEIKNFKSEPYWKIELEGKVDNKKIIAYHKKGNIFDKKIASSIIEKTKGKKAIISKVEKIIFKQSAPFPFDLTTLQLESYRCFGISPKETLAIAQNLYTSGLISYPRTSSQKLPEAINYKKILSKLTKQTAYSNLIKKLPFPLKPNNGPKTDPAHPAIYPTGEYFSLEQRSKKIYDLIVKRFLATFGPEAKKQTTTIEIDVNKEIFFTKGIITLEQGWQDFYMPYTSLKEIELPDVKENQEVKQIKISLLEEKTQPPRRYTQASIIKELEKRNLGTKATRAQIIDALYQRNYIIEKSIIATELGIKTVEALQKFSPEILDEALTRHFEEEMEQIREEKKAKEEVLEEAKKVLIKILEKFRKNEEKIGKSLLEATRETQNQATTIGKCNLCNGDLVIRKGKYGLFVACNKFPKCKNTFRLPKYTFPKPTDKKCQECSFPVVLMIRKGKQPFEYCINPKCKLKKEWFEKNSKS